MAGDEPYLLSGVSDVAVLDDGRVAVALTTDNTIRFYDDRGRYINRIGGSGQGPGRFTQLERVFHIPGGLYAYQSRGPSWLFEEETGRLLGGFTVPTLAGFAPVALHGVFPDGSLLVSPAPQDRPLESGVYVRMSPLFRLALNGRRDTLGVFPSLTYVNVLGTRGIHQAYGPQQHLIVIGNRFGRAFTSDFDIAVHDSLGQPLLKIRRPWSPVAITGEDRRRFREDLLGSIPEGTGAARLRAMFNDWINAMVFPAFHEAHGVVHSDQEGNIWVQRLDQREWAGWSYTRAYLGPADRPTSWDVFDSQGRWLGIVETPAGLRVLEIGENYVAGVWTDDLDVEFVRIHEIRKPMD